MTAFVVKNGKIKVFVISPLFHIFHTEYVENLLILSFNFRKSL